VFVVIVGFLPFRDNKNFYECFIGFFGDTFSTIQPYFLMSILFLSCVMSFFAIKRPLFSFIVLVCTFIFFLIYIIPYSIEIVMFGFTSPWIGGSMSTYQISFKLIGAVSHIVEFDIAFLLYSIITLIIRVRKNKQIKSL